MSLAASDFAIVSNLLLERSGISLKPGKEYLVESRLMPVAQQGGFSSVAVLLAALLREPHFWTEKIIDALTTNETSFFRDCWPFQAIIKDILPELMRRRARSRRIDIWCAAASSGQEPYTLAIMIREELPELLMWDLRIRASDISETMLERCRKAEFSQMEVNRGLSADLLRRYFKKDGLRYRLDQRTKDMVSFERLNLIDVFPRTDPIDLVMIRNVLIYFDEDTKNCILAEVKRTLAPNGFIMLGTAETMQDSDFSRIVGDKTSYYRRTA